MKRQQPIWVRSDRKNDKNRPGRKRYAAWVAAFFASGILAHAAIPLLPGTGQVTGSSWVVVRSVAGNAEASVETVTGSSGAPTRAIHLKMTGTQGYAEWRVQPYVPVTPGDTVAFSAEVKGQGTASAPYVGVYGYPSNGGSPTLLAWITGTAGTMGWTQLSRNISVPTTVNALRIGAGLSQTMGDMWLANPSLKVPNVAELLPPIDQTATYWAPVLSVNNTANWKPVLTAGPSGTSVQALYLQKLVTTGYVEWRPTARVPIPAGTQATVSAWMKTQSTTSAPYIQVFPMAGDAVTGGALVTIAGTAGTTGWTQLSGTFTVPSNADGVRLGMGLSSTAGELWIAAPSICTPTDGGRSLRQLVTGTILSAPSVVAGGTMATFQIAPAQTLTSTQAAGLDLVFLDDGRRIALGPESAALAYNSTTNTLSGSLPISKWAKVGKFSWEIQAPGLVIEGADGGSSLQVTTGSPPAYLTGYSYYANGPANSVATGSGTQTPFSYSPAVTTAPTSFFKSWHDTTGGHQYDAYATATACYDAGGAWNAYALEQRLMQILEADPQAMVQIRLDVNAPPWWLVLNSSECYIPSTPPGGMTQWQSFGSDAWVTFAGKAVTDLVKDLRTRPAGKCVRSVLPMAFSTGEFQLWGEATGQGYTYDCSVPAQLAFAAWQTQQGIATAQQTTLPNAALEWSTTTPHFTAGATDAATRANFFKFLGERQAANIASIVNAIKTYDAQLGCAVYYGYLFEHAANPHRFLYAGSLGLDKLLNLAPNLDSVTAPASYLLRGMSLPHAFMYPVSSVSLHGMQPGIEDDVRNVLCPVPQDSSGPKLPTWADSLQSMDKLRYLAASHGASVRYLPLYNPDQFQDPQPLGELASLNTLLQPRQPVPIGAANQIALVLDTDGLPRAGELTDADGSLLNCVGKVQEPLTRTGNPVAYITMKDWQSHPTWWNTVVVPLPGLLSTAGANALAARFGTLPTIGLNDSFCVFRAGLPATVISTTGSTALNTLWGLLATSAAISLPQPTYWYLGGDFTATVLYPNPAGTPQDYVIYSSP